jgi:hypothetical protein
MHQARESTWTICPGQCRAMHGTHVVAVVAVLLRDLECAGAVHTQGRLCLGWLMQKHARQGRCAQLQVAACALVKTTPAAHRGCKGPAGGTGNQWVETLVTTGNSHVPG